MTTHIDRADIYELPEIITASQAYKGIGTMGFRVIIKRTNTSTYSNGFNVCFQSLIYNYISKRYEHNAIIKPHFCETYAIALDKFWELRNQKS